MKNLKVLALAMVAILSVFTENIFAKEVKTSGYTSIDVMSNYVWRGQKLSNSWVIQPSVGITYGSFDANIWANYDSDSVIDEGDGHGEFTETDLTVSYTYSIDKLALTAGYIYYALTGTNDTQEIFISSTYDMFLNPSLTIYYDYDEGQGAFIIASIGHSFNFIKDIPLEVSTSASYNINNKVMGFDEDGNDFSNFYNAELSTSLSIQLSDVISVTPRVAYSFPLSNDAKEALSAISDDGDRDIFYGGINLTLSF